MPSMAAPWHRNVKPRAKTEQARRHRRGSVRLQFHFLRSGQIAWSVAFRPAAHEDRSVLLGHPPGMEVRARLLDRRAETLQALAVVLEHDQHVALEVAGPPEEVRLVGADRGAAARAAGRRG